MKLLMTDRPVSAALPQDAAAVDLSALRIANCVAPPKLVSGFAIFSRMEVSACIFFIR